MRYCKKCEKFCLEYNPKFQKEICMNPKCDTNKEQTKSKKQFDLKHLQTHQKYC